MKKRLLLVLAAAALLLTVIAPAETTPPPEKFSDLVVETACPTCGVKAANDPLFETNHALCKNCGLRNCDPAYARREHSLCGGCGLQKCSPEYDADAHMKCAGCLEQLCISEAEHSSCAGCHRYLCRESDDYNSYTHSVNAYGRFTCLDYPEEPVPTPTPEPIPAPKPVTPPEEEEKKDPICPGGCDAPEPCTTCNGYLCEGKYLCQLPKCQLKLPDDSICGMHHQYQCTGNSSHNPACYICGLCMENPAHKAIECSECGRCSGEHTNRCSQNAAAQG